MKIEQFTCIMAVAFASLALFPVGCLGENSTEELEIRLDSSPIDRTQVVVVGSYAGILNTVRPAVVSVFSSRNLQGPVVSGGSLEDRVYGSPEHRSAPVLVHSGLGSGVIVSPLGYVLTNNHVIEGADEVSVALENGKEIKAEVVGTDPKTDLAVLRIPVGDLPTAVFADSDEVAVGDIVFALGNALGIGHAVTTGIISARGRMGMGILGEEGYEDFLQTDASMNIGNSGGPLVDSKGRVIGINTAIASPGGGNVGIGFAIPINLARGVMESLIEHGEVLRGFLGVTLQDLTSELTEVFGAEQGGVLVVNVVAESPADGAGIKRGDVVVGLDGKSIESAEHLRLWVGQMAPDAKIQLSLLRNGEQVEVPIVLGRQVVLNAGTEEGPVLEVEEFLDGIVMEPLNPELRELGGISGELEGLIVVEMDPLSPYAEAMPVGAVIVEINRRTPADLEEARQFLRPGRNLLLLVIDGLHRYATVEVRAD